MQTPVSKVLECSTILTSWVTSKVSDPKSIAFVASSPSITEKPETNRAPKVTFRDVCAASVMKPGDVRLRRFALLVPVSTMAESSSMLTGPVASKVSVPKLAVVSPSVIEEPANRALFVTVRYVPWASVMEPADERPRLLTVLVPVSAVAEPSTMLTAPVELKVSDPKLVVSNALSPSVIDEPENAAFFVTVRLVPAASVVEPVDARLRVFAVLAPVSTVAESSAMLTVPVELKVSEPKLIVSAALSPSVTDEPENSALKVTPRLVPAASVMEPTDVRLRPPTLLVPVSTVAESSAMLTECASKVSEPKLVRPVALSPSVIDEPEKVALFNT